MEATADQAQQGLKPNTFKGALIGLTEVRPCYKAS
jgi:hypothetical protein